MTLPVSKEDLGVLRNTDTACLTQWMGYLTQSNGDELLGIIGRDVHSHHVWKKHLQHNGEVA